MILILQLQFGIDELNYDGFPQLGLPEVINFSFGDQVLQLQVKHGILLCGKTENAYC